MAIATKPLTGTQEVRIAKARAITEAQMLVAKEIASRHFHDSDDEIVVAILQALATNYAATVDASKS